MPNQAFIAPLILIPGAELPSGEFGFELGTAPPDATPEEPGATGVVAAGTPFEAAGAFGIIEAGGGGA